MQSCKFGFNKAYKRHRCNNVGRQFFAVFHLKLEGPAIHAFANVSMSNSAEKNMTFN